MKLRYPVGVVLAMLLGLALMQMVRRRPAEAPGLAEAVPTDESSVPEPQVDLAATPSPAPISPPSPGTNRLLNLVTNGEGSLRLSREAIDGWLRSGRTNAEDLLAARQAGGGLEFLRMALTNFPNDPRVLLAAVALKDDTQTVRDRLDRFKAAAPDNALADYLSARDHFRNSRPEQALADLLAAGGKKGFQDYTLDAIQNAEELYLQAGMTPAEAKAQAASTTLLPHLGELKGLAQDISDSQRQSQGAGDIASVEQMAQMGLQLGQQMGTGEGSRTLLSQMVGLAVERAVISALVGTQSYDFLQGTPIDYAAQLDARRAAARQDARFVDQWMRNASETDLISYFDRFKIYGEAGAVAWMRQRQKVP